MKQSVKYNKEKYNQIWNCGNIQNPQIWSLWEIVKNFQEKQNLEIGAGNWPTIPIKNGYFLDISESAIENLKQLGAKAVVGDITNLPFENNFFDLVVAKEVLEHIADDIKAVSEIARVLKPSGVFLFSVPLRKDLYSKFDLVAGHRRRYEIAELRDLLYKKGFKILKYRYPSFYLKILDKGLQVIKVKTFLLENNRYEKILQASSTITNLYVRSLAFLDKIGAPKWKTDIENLMSYKDKAIVILCQKSK